MRLLYGGLLILCPAVASAADLGKIDRTIKKEPVYKARPGYCLLVFGREAKARVWLVWDGDILYVDHNGNGDLTDPDDRIERTKTPNGAQERVFKTGGISLSEDGRPLNYTGLLVLHTVDHTCVFCEGRFLQVNQGGLHFAASSRNAPVIHFDGPLTLSPPPEALDPSSRGGSCPH